ncbi:hypothetical protein MTO96_046137 [Rhipicephalus appendiculatus]
MRCHETAGSRTHPAQQQQHDVFPSLARLVTNLAPTLQKNMYAVNNNRARSTNINVITISSRRARAPSDSVRTTQLRLIVWYEASPDRDQQEDDHAGRHEVQVDGVLHPAHRGAPLAYLRLRTVLDDQGYRRGRPREASSSRRRRPTHDVREAADATSSLAS